MGYTPAVEYITVSFIAHWIELIADPMSRRHPAALNIMDSM